MESRIIQEYIHRCGTIVWVAVTMQELVGYQDDMCNNITHCPHCEQALEWEDLQILENVKELGWHDQ